MTEKEPVFSNSVWQKASSFLSQKPVETAVAYRDCTCWSLCLVLHWLYKLQGKCGFYMSSHVNSYFQQLKQYRPEWWQTIFEIAFCDILRFPIGPFPHSAVLGLWTKSRQVTCLGCLPHLPRGFQAGLLCTRKSQPLKMFIKNWSSENKRVIYSSIVCITPLNKEIICADLSALHW